MEIPTIVQRPEVVPEAIDAWRAWAVVEVEGELRLSSLTRPERWIPHAPVTAFCRHPTHLRPRRFCSCGVYALPRPELLAGLGQIAGGAIGQVAVWGRVVEHEHGLRAQVAYPARLRLVCASCLVEGVGRDAEVVGTVRHERGVAVLRPVCRSHASEAEGPFRDARDVEVSLCATYAVDRLPSAAIDRIGSGDPEIAAAEAARRRRLVAGRLAMLVLVVALAIPVLRHADALSPAANGSPYAVNPFVVQTVSSGRAGSSGVPTGEGTRRRAHCAPRDGVCDAWEESVRLRAWTSERTPGS